VVRFPPVPAAFRTMSQNPVPRCGKTLHRYKSHDSKPLGDLDGISVHLHGGKSLH
jgi:hypothetical protein